jgi:hypothetical protein
VAEVGERRSESADLVCGPLTDEVEPYRREYLSLCLLQRV